MTDPNAITKSITVAAPQEIAFRVFTEGIARWWPLETHKIGATKAVNAVVEPRQGGRWYEIGADGSECNWGKVLAWEPPSRVLLSWEISCDWRHDAKIDTEVEVRFIAEGTRSTRVELAHRKLDRYGDREEEMRGVFNSPGGWPGLLERFKKLAEQ